jgi:chromosome partitioning protein
VFNGRLAARREGLQGKLMSHKGIPSMHVVALCSQKGGSGKTTLSGHLAVQAELAGAGPVALIDSDPQGSLAAWWNERDGDAPAFVSTTLAALPGDLERLRLEGCRLVVIDTPPAINMAIQRVINVADLVVIPTRPSPHDLRAVAGTVEMVERVQGRMVFVVNAANLRAKITADAVIALSQHGTVAPAFIQQRVDFATSMIDGRTVCEVAPEGRSAQEVRLLWEYLAMLLERRERLRVFQQPASHGFGRRAYLEGASA